jgi:hypothetical protein
MVSPLLIHQTLTTKQEKHKVNRRRDLLHLQKHKKSNKKRKQHHKILLIQATCRFPQEIKKQAMDEQFACFVEMIEKIHVSVPLMDVLHVPSYAKYIKDIINNKRPLPSEKVLVWFC